MSRLRAARTTRPLGGHARLLRRSSAAREACARRRLLAGYLARPLVGAGARVVGVGSILRRARAPAPSARKSSSVTSRRSTSRSSPLVRRRPLRRPHRAPPRAGRVLAACGRCSRRDGRLVLTTPNVANWAIRLSLLGGRWRYTERGILDARTPTSSRGRRSSRPSTRAGYRVVGSTHTAPVPCTRQLRGRGVAHAVGVARPSLLAYQFVLAADAA